VALTFESPEEVWVSAAPDLAAIAIGNLLQNAFNFTDEGSVRVALNREALVIEDTGPGIPQAVRDRLFEPFVKGSDDASTGWGLGLSIVKRVVDYLGWVVRFDEAVNGGSRVTVTFASPAPI
jgi:signal transduction histidine kinase